MLQGQHLCTRRSPGACRVALGAEGTCGAGGRDTSGAAAPASKGWVGAGGAPTALSKMLRLALGLGTGKDGLQAGDSSARGLSPSHR